MKRAPTIFLPRLSRGASPYAGHASRAKRLERVIGRSLAGVCFIFGAQTIPFSLKSESTMNQSWAWAFGLLLYAALIAAIGAGLAGRIVHPTAVAVAVAFAAILVTWPFAAVDPSRVLPTEPWPWYLCNVATAAAAVAFSDVIATGYALGVATAYCLVRLTPPGGGLPLERAALDGGYAFIIGITTVLIVGILRSSAATVDGVEAAAVLRYGAATREHAVEVERMAVDATLHDSVMAALLAAGRASTAADRRYTVALARTALDVITDSTGGPTQDPVTLSEVIGRFTNICHELGIAATLSAQGLDDAPVPGTVAEVFFGATLQALMNSVQHAGPGSIRRTVTATWTKQRLTVTVTDDGIGFDTATPSSRLGIRTSILERMNSVGGTAVIASVPGHGTSVTLTWDAPDRPHDDGNSSRGDI